MLCRLRGVTEARRRGAVGLRPAAKAWRRRPWVRRAILVPGRPEGGRERRGSAPVGRDRPVGEGAGGGGEGDGGAGEAGGGGGEESGRARGAVWADGGGVGVGGCDDERHRESIGWGRGG